MTKGILACTQYQHESMSYKNTLKYCAAEGSLTISRFGLIGPH